MFCRRYADLAHPCCRVITRAIALLICCGLAAGVSAREKHESARPRTASRPSGRARTLTPDDGLAVIAAALDTRVHVDHEPDCSHLVHAIYTRAGFPYSYAPSSDLYAGTREFQRVSRPQPGDLVVWRGARRHRGQPRAVTSSSARFVRGSALTHMTRRTGKHRGGARFYRYIKGSSAIARK